MDRIHRTASTRVGQVLDLRGSYVGEYQGEGFARQISRVRRSDVFRKICTRPHTLGIGQFFRCE